MRPFDLDLLQTLVAIAETGSLSAAAPRVHRSQSAVSEQMRKLEQHCGVTLLVRGKLGASLTSAGERLVVHARRLLALSEEAFRDVLGMPLAGDLRLAITDYFRPATITLLLKRLRERYPQLKLHVATRQSLMIENRRDFDIGLSMRLLDDDSASDEDGRIRLGREPLSWIASPALALDAARRLPLVVLPEACSLQRLIIRTLNQSDIDYEIAHSAAGVAGLHLALAAGLGLACLNRSAIPAGMATLDGDFGLPAMPDIEFSILPPQAGESALVAEVRHLLAKELA
ncbi:LysR family transcriptional regulator [Labrys portucalensis]|uniref:LysR family transcriptional regulator n=1 Tax=Labrys neptuniae TaxID=376174 RepID=A0ABV6Z850_9HYPH|nr:LysR family transcriptional regulator [Labrys neptuniae]MDT3377811.1 LysR family transcriptional regulator [Labrys neptuniae]